MSMLKNSQKILRSDDAFVLILFIALILGGIVRFMPVAMAGFPVNDGGMFYVMVEELKLNHFVLPAFTQYNLSDIPFAYPPFGLYLTAALSALFHIPALNLIRWLPPLISTFSLLAFYLMADEILRSKTQGALATAFYGLLPASFEWAIMGGGITRAFGLMFLFLTIAYANRLFTRTTSLHAVLTTLFGTLAFFSHPETGVQSAALCILLWFFRGRSKRTLLWSIGVSFGVLALTAPWWGTVLGYHGLVPFQSALQTSDDGTFHLAELIMLQFGGGVFFNLTIAIGLVGFLAVVAQKRFLLPFWMIVPFLVDPRSAGGMTLVAVSMLAGYGFDAIIAPALLSLRGREAIWSGDRFAIITLFGIVFYLFFNAGIFGLDIVGQSLSVEDRETIAWVETNIPHSNDFFLITGEQYSMNDPFQEWFPALTKQRSFTTLQGKEWTLAENFFPFYGELVDLQHCADADCVATWGKRNKLKHDYLLVKKYPQGGTSQLQISLEWLLQSIQESANYEITYETESTVIYNNLER